MIGPSQATTTQTDRPPAGKETTMTYTEKMNLQKSEEYQYYMKSLCKLASTYVARIRQQFAAKAIEMYQNETVRRLVIEYGKEMETLEAHRLRDFKYAAIDEVIMNGLEDSVLNHASDYGHTIFFLFGIE